MTGVKDRHIIGFGHCVDCGEQLDKIAVRVDVLLPVGGKQDVAAPGQPQTRMDIACLDFFKACPQNLRHGTADDERALLRHSALHQVPARMLRIAEIDVADDIHDAAVRLLGQAFVLAAVPRLHVKNRNMQTLRADHGKAGIGVAQNEHRVRPEPRHQFIRSVDNVPDRRAEIVARGVQIIVRRAETEIVKKHLIERVVIVLPGVHKNLFKIPVTAFDRGGQPDDLRPCADDRHELQLSHGHTSSK